MRILLVEDDASQRYLYRRWLERAGHQVEEAASLAHLVERDPSRWVPEVIVCDHQLPEGKTHEDVLRHWPQIPMILISGYPKPDGYTGVWIQKSFDEVDLIRAVAAIP
jgi:CheY-like chemotaxis protein